MPLASEARDNLFTAGDRCYRRATRAGLSRLPESDKNVRPTIDLGQGGRTFLSVRAKAHKRFQLVGFTMFRLRSPIRPLSSLDRSSEPIGLAGSTPCPDYDRCTEQRGRDVPHPERCDQSSPPARPCLSCSAPC